MVADAESSGMRSPLLRVIGAAWIGGSIFSAVLDLRHLEPLWLSLPNLVSSVGVVFGGCGLVALRRWARIVLLFSFPIPLATNAMDAFFFLFHQTDYGLSALLFGINLAAIATLIACFFFWPDRGPAPSIRNR
jgi:hypothetical protein